jgi:tRNA U34 5-methylaminomethyl-2-thiouridine-forming methyltransferase MnmC
LARLANGAHAVYAADYDEKMHPGLGPQAEADLLYVQQLQLVERMRATPDEFVVWDVGLGAAANAIAVLRATRELTQPLRLVSFDNTAAPLAFALENAAALGYLHGYEQTLAALLKQQRLQFKDGAHEVDWQFHCTDFPAWLESATGAPLARRDATLAPTGGECPGENCPSDSRIEPLNRESVGAPASAPALGMHRSKAGGDAGAPGNREETFNTQHSTSNVPGQTFGPSLDVESSMLNVECSQGFLGEAGVRGERNAPAPHAILFDAFSPAKNPAMWTLPLFTNLFRALDPTRPCALTTYSRSTMFRVSLLLAGFHVGSGAATGMKEETTIAANTPALIASPLDQRWLERAHRSDSAEPLRTPVYARAKLSEANWELLRHHKQFLGTTC